MKSATIVLDSGGTLSYTPAELQCSVRAREPKQADLSFPTSAAENRYTAKAP